MKVLDNSPLPYVPSFMQKPNHLAQRMAVYRKKVEQEKAKKNQQRPEEWR